MVNHIDRPNPDELLKRVKAEEEQEKRGRLKIFLGYAPGVGKTYTMLEAGRVRKKEIDVVIGIVETHGRFDTEALLEGFEIIPRREVEYRGIKLTDMNIDALLKRHPRLALVDEMAHSNAPGSRHPKRYQDIQELLEAGIDVYTTLNIQHIESGRNAVAQITGIWVRETIPDSVIDSATEIEMVDLPPDELLQRLNEGKVYIPEQIRPAVESFFRKGNLTALRELALRTASKHVDGQTLEYMKTHGITGPWSSAERILACVSSGVAGARVVRNARRLAHQLSAVWYAINVETPDTHLSPERQARITNILRMAERMGATIGTIQGNSVANAILEYAAKNHITKIMISKSSSFHWRNLVGMSFADRLTGHNEQFDVIIVGGAAEPALKKHANDEKYFLPDWLDYVKGIVLVVASTLFGELLHNRFTPTTIAMLYLLSVVVAAYYWGLGPSIMVSVLGVLAFDFFNVPPYLTFRVADTQYIFTFFALLLVAVMISYLGRRVRRQTESVIRREKQTASLYALGKDLAISNDMDTYLNAIIKRASETFGYDTAILLPDLLNKENLKTAAKSAGIHIDENESAAAVWAFQHQKIVGHGTDTLPNAKARHFPLVTARGPVGVLAIFAADDVLNLSIDQEHLLEAYTDLAAVAIESIQLAKEAQHAQILRDTEKLQTALLNSVSHDLRTPLVSIIGVLSILHQQGINLNDDSRMNLIQVAHSEAEKLNHVVANLLDVSRIEGSAVKVSRQPSDVQELVNAALEQLENQIKMRTIKLEIPINLPFITADFSLIEQALVNVLENAIKYSPEDTIITIKAYQELNSVAIEIADRGRGIPAEELTHIFDKFYRIQQPDSVAGTGLGLFISKSFIEANGGNITALNNPGGGTITKITLPGIGTKNGGQK